VPMGVVAAVVLPRLEVREVFHFMDMELELGS